MASWYAWVEVSGNHWVPVEIQCEGPPARGDSVGFSDPVTAVRHTFEAREVHWSATPSQGVRYILGRVRSLVLT